MPFVEARIFRIELGNFFIPPALATKMAKLRIICKATTIASIDHLCCEYPDSEYSLYVTTQVRLYLHPSLEGVRHFESSWTLRAIALVVTPFRLCFLTWLGIVPMGVPPNSPEFFILITE